MNLIEMCRNSVIYVYIREASKNVTKVTQSVHLQSRLPTGKNCYQGNDFYFLDLIFTLCEYSIRAVKG